VLVIILGKNKSLKERCRFSVMASADGILGNGKNLKKKEQTFG
jgi:hypothetical protein